ncbi:MAG: murein biosynthesis integral membrane protein MurJ [Alphaproteobacteria bacterium]|jgi:putative peptidoglycan lipid II flippase|nr:murein biosynthesis integral membrane protein MurJ [Alphaproteobacteria bacterium]
MPLLRAVATVGGLTLLSRVAGFVRDVLMAAVLGAGPVADAFFVALKLPNLFRRLFAEGAFSVSFVPLFSAELQSRGRPAARRLAEEALALMVAVLAPLTVLAVAAMPWIIPVMAPGFVDDGDRYALAVEFARITFPYLFVMSLVALMGGVLNALDRFAPFAAAPVLFNLTLISALLGATAWFATPGHALAYAVAAAGIVQLLWLAWHCRRAGFALRLPRPRLTPAMRRLLRLMGPGALGAGVMQINLFVDTLLASLLPAGAISYLYYADRLYQLPLGVIGIAIGTAVLPILSRQVEAGGASAANAPAMDTQNRALEFGLMLALPAAAALMVIPAPILTVLFERGAFGPEETMATAAALAAYALGIPAYILVKVLSTAYFARQDTASPVKVAVVCTMANIALSLSLIWWLGHVGIALATGITAWVNAALLARGLRRHGFLAVDARLRRRLPRMALATAGMAAALYGGALLLAATLAGGLALQIAALAGLVLGGAAVYLALVVLTGAARLQDVAALLKARRM